MAPRRGSAQPSAPTPAPETPRVDAIAEDAARRLRSATDALPGTAELIAEALLAAGATGTRHDPSGCPLAAYLHRFAADAAAALGARLVVDRATASLSWPVGRVCVPLPLAAYEFVTAFDAGAFPALARGTPI